MDDATKVSIEALKRIRDEAKAGKNPRKPKPKPKPERVTRGEGAVLLEDVRHFLLRFVIYPSEQRRSRMFSGSLMRISWAHGKARQGLPFCRPNRRRERRDRWKYRSFWFPIRSRP